MTAPTFRPPQAPQDQTGAIERARPAIEPPGRNRASAGADRRVAEIAGEQHGVVHRDQLREAGLSGDAVAHRQTKGRLHPVLPDVYAVGHAALSDLGRGQAALLAGGPESMLADDYSAALWELLPFPDDVHLIVPRDGRRPNRRERRQRAFELVVHRPLELPDATLRRGLRTTSVPRLLLDLAATGPRTNVVRALEQAYIDRRTSTPQLEACLAAHPHHRGRRRLAELVADPRTRSWLERRFLKLLREARLPAPDANKKVNGHLVDFVWRGLHVIVETDGWGPHGSRMAFDRDRRRDLDHRAAGWTVIRISARMLEREPQAVIARLGAVLLAAAT